MRWIDPQSLPAVEGTVVQFVMNRDGEFDGLVLATTPDELKLVHFPPHLAGEVAAAIEVEDRIAVHGVRPRGAEVIAAVALVAASGRRIVDEGPDAPSAESAASPNDGVHHDQELSGRVRLSLFGPKGELRGALLEDGTALRIGKKEAGQSAELLKPGAFVAVRGTAIVRSCGRVLDAHEIGARPDELYPVKAAKPKHEDRVEA